MNTKSLTAGSARPGAAFAPPPLARPRHPRQVAMERAAGRAALGAQHAFAALGLFLFTGAVLPLLLHESGVALDPAEGNPLLRNVYGAFYAGALVLAAVHARAAAAAVRRSPATLALVVLAVASTAWSAAPDLSLRRGLALLGTTAFGVFLAARYDNRALLRLLAVVFGAAAVLSLLFAVGLPRYGIDEAPHAGAWRGIYAQKNGLGQTMVMGTVVLLLASRQLRAGRRAAWAAAALSAALLVLSTSKTALTVLATLLLLTALYRVLRWRTTLAVPTLIAMVLAGGVAALWVVGNTELLLASLGKDPSLTGRAPMWNAALGTLAGEPWLGFGYSAFWQGLEGPSRDVVLALEWEAPHAHNGFLDLGLQLGAAGVALFLAALLPALVRAVRVLRRTRGTDGLWPLVFLSFLVLYNVTETTLLQQNSLYWV
ncbi:MAG TPA: O-antigen ligase family protein, partial [Longimicrobium sp.]|nr:O-antigen ligase family protein [Longimicrobium sp.]